ncbi:MAG: glycosyltransferase family 39 protein [Magnetococcales bacterium]|nr:glycosyltransferase family 39 protein [Magnetococcales bacterium]MBF0322708.1 glycosyltransferase family 39 protein [Magnetococcales bacterium]
MAGHHAVLGIRTGGDTGRYVGAAKNILQGLPLQGKGTMNLFYDYFLAWVFGIGGGETSLVASQCLVTLGCALLLHLAVEKVFDRNVATIAAFVFLLNPEVQRWVFFILPEAIATCALVALVSLAWLARYQQRWVVLALLMGLVLGLTRPEGKYFLIPVIVYWFINLPSSGRWPAWSMLGILGCLFVLTGNADVHENFSEHFITGSYIWGYAGLNPNPDQALIKVGEKGVFSTILYMMENHPTLLLETILMRLWMFVSHMRPFYSNVHNVASFIFCLVLYVLSCLAWWRCKAYRPDMALLWMVTGIQALMVVLTFDDWDGRWLNRVMPSLSILAACGWAGLFLATARDHQAGGGVTGS